MCELQHGRGCLHCEPSYFVDHRDFFDHLFVQLADLWVAIDPLVPTQADGKFTVQLRVHSKVLFAIH
jgi:hypothetical protein